jgi:hypothetical protein
VTASGVGAIFKCHPYKTKLGLYLQKRDAEADLEIVDSAVLRRGRLLESGVAEGVREVRPDWSITKANDFIFEPLLSIPAPGGERRVGLGATPDFIIQCPEKGRGVLQTKTALPDVFEADWTPTLPPLWIVLQVQQEMMLEEVTWGAVAVMVVDPWNLPIHIYEFEAHPDTHKLIRTRAVQFWEQIAAQRQPEADYGQDADLLKQMYPKDNGIILDLHGDNRLHELVALREERKAELSKMKPLEKDLKIIEAEIREKIGHALGAQGNGWEITCPTIQRKGYAVKDTEYRQLKIKHV